MRRLVAALVVLVLSVSLVGCGGGGEETANAEAAPTQQAEAPAPPPSTTAVNPDAAGPDRSPTETVDFQPLPLNKNVMPPSIRAALDDGQPMVILFYNPKQKVTDDLRAEIDAVVNKKYRGMIDLISFDVSRSLTKKGAKSDEAQRAALMTGELDVRITPYTIVVDKNGLQTARYAGFVDRSILEREILRATN